MFRAAKTEARGAPRLRFARVGQTKDIFFSVFPIFFAYLLLSNRSSCKSNTVIVAATAAHVPHLSGQEQ